MTYYYTGELYHHGIKGMKWGVRRLKQNVSAYRIKRHGKAGHTQDALNSNKHLTTKKQNIERAKQYVKERLKKKETSKEDVRVQEDRKLASKNRRKLSDAELKKRINRMELERKMKDLTDKDISPGKTAINEILANSGKKVATTVITGATLYAIKAGLEGKIDLKEAATYLAPKPKNK